MKTTIFPPIPHSQFPDEDATQSPAVKTVARFIIDGVEFPTFAAAIEHRENQIEAKIRHLFRDATLHGQIENVQWVLDNRAELRRLLDY